MFAPFWWWWWILRDREGRGALVALLEGQESAAGIRHAFPTLHISTFATS